MGLRCYWRVQRDSPFTANQLHEAARVAAHANVGEQVVWLSEDSTAFYGEAPFDDDDVDRLVRLSERVAAAVGVPSEQSDSFETLGPSFELPELGRPLHSVVADLAVPKPASPQQDSGSVVFDDFLDQLAELDSAIESFEEVWDFQYVETTPANDAVAFVSVQHRLETSATSDVQLRVHGEPRTHRVHVEQILYDVLGRPVALETRECTQSVSNDRLVEMRINGWIPGAPDLATLTLRASAFLLHQGRLERISLTAYESSGLGTPIDVGPLRVTCCSFFLESSDDDLKISVLLDTTNSVPEALNAEFKIAIYRGTRKIEDVELTTNLHPETQSVLADDLYLFNDSDYENLTVTVDIRVEQFVGGAVFQRSLSGP